jgi:hypothetical protein
LKGKPAVAASIPEGLRLRGRRCVHATLPKTSDECADITPPQPCTKASAASGT